MVHRQKLSVDLVRRSSIPAAVSLSYAVQEGKPTHILAVRRDEREAHGQPKLPIGPGKCNWGGGGGGELLQHAAHEQSMSSA